MRHDNRKRRRIATLARLATGLLFVGMLMAAALLLSESSSSTPPIGYRIF
jgi:hypothetical protein